jgi:serine/threonine protein kinase
MAVAAPSGYKAILVSDTKFVLPEDLQLKEMIGKGVYGVVCSGRMREMDVAVSKINDLFVDKNGDFLRKKLRELRLLRHLRHENIVGLNMIFIPEPQDVFSEMYLISELTETDLTSIMKSNQNLTDDHFQFFIYQVLRALKYIHSAQVIHRDLKPRNLLVNANCDLRVCDFGLARIMFDNGVEIAPPQHSVSTRWYRAPEVICSWASYSYSVDLWSVGCILAEMVGAQPLFPGMSTQHQLQLISRVLGTQPEDLYLKLNNEKCKAFFESLPHTEPPDLAQILPNASAEAISLLRMLLVFDPDGRCTIEEAMKNPFMEALHNPEDEPLREPLSQDDFLFDSDPNLSEATLRHEVYKEMLATKDFVA